MTYKEEYITLKSANCNRKPRPLIKMGPHAGRVDLNALREAQK